MKNKKILLEIIAISFVIGCIIGYRLLNNNQIEDFYNYINEKELEDLKLDEDEMTKSRFSIAQDEADEEKKQIINDMVNNPSNSIQKEAKKLYESATNTKKRNNEGLKTLNTYIKKISNVSNINEFITTSMNIEKELNISILGNWTVSKDFSDNSKNILYLFPVSLDYDIGAEYYTESDYLYYHALIKQYNIKLLKLYGYKESDAKEMSKIVDDYYKDIASVSKKTEDYTDVTSNYNIMNINELQKVYTNIDIRTYLNNFNLKVDTFSVVDIKNYEKVNSYLTNDNLDILKSSVIIKILQSYADYTTEEFRELSAELTLKLQSKNEINSIEDDARNIVESYFENEIDKLYSAKYIDDNKVEYINNLTTDIINVYKNEITNNTWMEQSTKETALKKLDSLKVNIGYDKNIESYTNLFIVDSNLSLVDNIINLNKTMQEVMKNNLNNNKEISSLPQTMVNAFYNPQDNSINILTATFKLFDTNNSYYDNLGSIGMVIAHEITHAFDPNGAKFDEVGNLSNWWQEKDYEAFNSIKDKVINYYNKYEVTNGIFINGENTVGENIADLGAIETIIKVAENKNATEEEYKSLFTSFTKLWLSKDTNSYLQLLILQDVHSPAKYRVNATLASQDKFYEIYNIDESGSMYKAKEDRITIFN